MTYRIELASSARRQLHRLPEKAALAVTEFLAGPLAENPHRVGKRLRDQFESQWAARVGFYRIVYEIEDAVRVVLIVRIGFRADVYRP